MSGIVLFGSCGRIAIAQDTHQTLSQARKDHHVHHAAAERWFTATDENFATCPIT
jgi:hypothetical protein